MKQLVYLAVLLVACASASLTVNKINKLLDQFQNAYEQVKKHCGEEFLKKIGFEETCYEQQPKNNEDFDFIIVGGGSSGSALASRLSENPHWKILLVEAGDKPSVLTDIPSLSPIWRELNNTWKYNFVRQKNFGKGLEYGKVVAPTSKILGGTSTIRYLGFERGHPKNYDKIAEITGCKEWTYKNLLPYFKKLEDSRVRFADCPNRGQGGPITVENNVDRSNLVKTFVQAGAQEGYVVGDFNGGPLDAGEGVGYMQFCKRNGLRCSAEKAYLRSAQHRKNLKIITNAFTTKINFGKNCNPPRAEGISYIVNGKSYCAQAKKEVIVSSGGINSAKLLLLSGVGPKHDLKKLKIPVVKNLPVGKKLGNYITFYGLAFTANQSLCFLDTLNPKYLKKLAGTGGGPLQNSLGAAAIYVRSKEAIKSGCDIPDIELLFSDYAHSLGLFFDIKKEVAARYFKPIAKKYSFAILPTLIQPESYGALKLKTCNPCDPPKLYGNFLGCPSDVKRIIGGIRAAQKLIKTPAFAKYCVQQIKTPVPGCEKLCYDSDEYWECAIRTISGSINGIVSTNKMGCPKDKEAVVDSYFKVLGVKGLRVVDQSVFPVPISVSAIEIPAALLGEKASDLIKKEYCPETVVKYVQKEYVKEEPEVKYVKEEPEVKYVKEEPEVKYVKEEVAHYIQPVKYVKEEPDIHYVKPEVKYVKEEPEDHYVKPEVKYVQEEPDVHYVKPEVKYVKEEPEVHYVKPEVKYVKEPEVRYVKEPEVRYVQQEVKYVKEPEVRYVQQEVKYVKEPEVKYVEPKVKYVQPKVKCDKKDSSEEKGVKYVKVKKPVVKVIYESHES